jgi:hypothetical protein
MTVKELSVRDAYWMRVCERDAEWKNYCKFPTDETWKRYAEAAEAEKAAKKTADDAGVEIDN